MQPIIQGTLNSPTTTTADTPQPDTTLLPELVIDQLRAIRSQLPEIAPLTSRQRTAMRKRAQVPTEVLQASISVIGASDVVASAIKQPVGGVHALQDESNRWSAVEDELKALLNGVSGANLHRRERLALIGAQAYAIGTQLVRDPANVLLVPHVQEVKRLKKLAQRKKSPETTPAPAPQSTPQQPLLDAPKVEV